MGADKNIYSEKAESVVCVKLSSYIKRADKHLFYAKGLGDKYPTVDIVASLSGSNGRQMFCFFQVKSTINGLDTNKKLKVAISKKHILRLQNINAPTYIVGVDLKLSDLAKSECYILGVYNNYSKGFNSITTAHKLTNSTISLLKQEVEEFWNSTNSFATKRLFKTRFH